MVEFRTGKPAKTLFLFVNNFFNPKYWMIENWSQWINPINRMADHLFNYSPISILLDNNLHLPYFLGICQMLVDYNQCWEV